MKRGTTPTHIFTIPFDTSLISDLRISYAQNGEEIVCKCKNDCTLEEKTITVELSQEDTFKFECYKQIRIQVRVLTTGGEVLNSDVILLSVGECLNNEVLK
jgi:hypothetical protein